MLSDYLSKNGISNMEELIGREVFLILPRQGIKNYAIRRIQYGKQHKWMMCLPENYRVSELGESIFFTKEEAERYQIQQLYKYSKKQRDRVIEKKIKERNTELEELYRLLKILVSYVLIGMKILPIMKYLYIYVEFAMSIICLIMTLID